VKSSLSLDLAALEESQKLPGFEASESRNLMLLCFSDFKDDLLWVELNEQTT
jgi:hypothetical protein